MHASGAMARDLLQRTVEAMGGGDIRMHEWEIALMHRPFMAGEGSCARVIWLRSDPATLPEALENLPLTLLPRIDDTEGFCGLDLFVDRTTGDCLMTGVYENPQTVEVSRDQAETLREQMAEHMGMEITEVAEFELPLHLLGGPTAP